MLDLAELDGLYVGQLDPDELVAFEAAVARREAAREYSGTSGFMGLAKVRVYRKADDKESEKS